METAFRVLFQVGPLSLLAGIAGTLLVYFAYRRAAGLERRSFWRYLGASLIAGCIGYGIGTALGIGIACLTPRGSNLCGLMGIFGVGPLLAGIAMFGYACYQIVADSKINLIRVGETMLVGHGNVQSRPAQPHQSYSRFVAVLDVLGMKVWLEKENARSIAEALDVALVACGQSSSGRTSSSVNYGPIIDVIHFSDSLLAWSPDDSWASLGALCSSLKMIVGVALNNGVPLRGSIALGDVVCNQRTLKFVGQPIAEAYLWAEKQRPYRSVGVDLTPETVSKLVKRISDDPVPPHWRHELEIRVMRHEIDANECFIWYADCLFIDHWNHGMFLNCDPVEMFNRRKLPIPVDQRDSVQKKASDLREFYAQHQRHKGKEMSKLMGRRVERTRDFDTRINDSELQQADYVRLDALRRARAS